MQAVAWTVLLGALAVFCAGAVGVPWMVLAYLRTATVEEVALVEPKRGSVTLESTAGVLVLRQGEAAREVFEGTTVTTDAAASAFIQFFDGSTLGLEPNTSVTVRRMRRPRFDAAEVPRTIELQLDAAEGVRGWATVGTTWGDLRFVVSTPRRGVVQLGPETHARFDLDDQLLKVSTHDGESRVRNLGREIVVEANQRGEVRIGSPPIGPLPSLENILVNWDFQDPPVEANGWRLVFDPPSAAVESPGRSEHLTPPGGPSVITFERSGSGGSPADMYYVQSLADRDVSTSSYIGISATLRVLSQSLAGGGEGSPPTEFPVIIKLVYRDPDGDDTTWFVGFYAVPPPADAAETPALRDHVAVRPGEWIEFQSGNLLAPDSAYGFARRMRPLPRPMQLRRLEVVASGHDYASEIDRVRLWVK